MYGVTFGIVEFNFAWGPSVHLSQKGCYLESGHTAKRSASWYSGKVVTLLGGTSNLTLCFGGYFSKFQSPLPLVQRGIYDTTYKLAINIQLYTNGNVDRAYHPTGPDRTHTHQPHALLPLSICIHIHILFSASGTIAYGLLK